MSQLALHNAVERQQNMLAQTLLTEQQLKEIRAVEHVRYLSLLEDPSQDSNAEIITLATKFALTQSYKEAVAIIDAGGDVYGF